jgi:hypothetical protein
MTFFEFFPIKVFLVLEKKDAYGKVSSASPMDICLSKRRE